MTNEADSRVLCERRAGGVALVTLNRPEAHNACTRAMWRRLAAIWEELRNDAAVRVVVLTGAGESAFCAGADLVELAGRPPAASPFEPPPRLLENGDLDFWKPIVCAANGLALGSGLSMLLATDVRIAAEGASFGFPQVRWGLLSGHATQLAPRFLPHPVAMELLLTGDPIPAERALALGLVNRVVPRERLLAEAFAVAERIAGHAPLALQGIKEAALRGLDMSLRDAIAWGLRMERLNAATADAAEGPRAFAEKRPPRWQGR